MNRSGLYYQPLGEGAENLELDAVDRSRVHTTAILRQPANDAVVLHEQGHSSRPPPGEAADGVDGT